VKSTITATELAKNLSDILSRVRYRGEAFLIERNGEPVASLGPVDTPRLLTFEELVARVGDLVPPGEGFADDLEAIQAEQPLVDAPAWPNS
jgi:antitoxin (DNA-binding transcriptional repressor) of toxin-antitoxin stability system